MFGIVKQGSGSFSKDNNPFSDPFSEIFSQGRAPVKINFIKNVETQEAHPFKINMSEREVKYLNDQWNRLRKNNHRVPRKEKVNSHILRNMTSWELVIGKLKKKNKNVRMQNKNTNFNNE